MSHQRRRVLQMIALGSVVGSAGCSSNGNESGTNDTQQSPENSEATSNTTQSQTEDPTPESSSLSSTWMATNANEAKTRATNAVSVSSAPSFDWQLPTESGANNYWYSPAVGNNERVIVFQNENFEQVQRTVYGIDPAGPNVDWSVDIGESSFLIPECSLVDGTAYIPMNDGVQLIDTETGSRQTTLSTPGDCNRALVSDGVIFSGGSDAITAFERGSHTELWSEPDFSIGANFSSPFAIGEYIGVAAVRNAIGFNLSDGSIEWTTEVSPSTGTGPSVDSTHAYIGDRDRGLLKLELSTGDIVWESATDSVPGAVSVGESQVYTAVDTTLTAFNKETGRQQWEATDVIDVDAIPAVVGNTVVAGTFGGSTLRGLSTEDGSEQWAVEIPGTFYGRVSATAGGIFPSHLNGDVIKLS